MIPMRRKNTRPQFAGRSDLATFLGNGYRMGALEVEGEEEWIRDGSPHIPFIDGEEGRSLDDAKERSGGMQCSGEDNPPSFEEADILFTPGDDIIPIIAERFEDFRASDRAHFGIAIYDEDTICEGNEGAGSKTDPFIGNRIGSEDLISSIDNVAWVESAQCRRFARKPIEYPFPEMVDVFMDTEGLG